MALHLLDADAVIDYLRIIHATVALIDDLALQGHSLCVSDVIVAEVYTNLYERERSDAEELLGQCRFLETGIVAARQAGQWRFRHARQGLTLAATDCLIAATAWQYAAVLVTGNVRHFPMPEITVLPLPRVR